MPHGSGTRTAVMQASQIAPVPSVEGSEMRKIKSPYQRRRKHKSRLVNRHPIPLSSGATYSFVIRFMILSPSPRLLSAIQPNSSLTMEALR